MNPEKILRRLVIPVAMALGTLAALPANAAFLLSDNVNRLGGVGYYPQYASGISIERITTGATYSYLIDDASNTGLGNTDAELIATDSKSDGRELLDGGAALLGGDYGANSKWDNSTGTTILFDLKSNYLVESVKLSVDWRINQGVATFQVFVSTDNITYTALGTWDGGHTVLNTTSSEVDVGRNTEIGIVSTTVGGSEARYVKIFVSNWNEAHTSRPFHQLSLGEVAIWGDNVPSPAVPEPSTCALIASAVVFGIAILRRRFA
ncbi:MAG: discoidin domain-containing protein [Opitutaceae bacterium]|jgi:hypothetical protein|nr:discoidin domain-containing protein [Opitutaceae bacterium]